MVDILGIHAFTVNEKSYILDVASGSVANCDAQTINALETLKNAEGNFTKAMELAQNTEEQEILTELLELKNENILFTKDLATYTPPKTEIKSMCLNISHDCDLRCAYCFASTGSFGGERLNMSLETAKQAIDFLMRNSGNRTFLEVDFFGGEPMMNIDVVMATVAYARIEEKKFNKEIAFTFTTNCVSLTDDVTNWANDNNISVVLSHDGRKDVHDNTRYFAGGKGSYDVVTEHINEHIKNTKTKYYVRGTFTGENMDFVEDIKHWLDLGWRELSMEPAVEKSGARMLDICHLDELKTEYHKLARLYQEEKTAGTPFEFFHFNMDLQHATCLPKRVTGCGAGYEYFVAIPNGDLYPCHQFVGRENYKMGNLNDGITNIDQRESFRNCHVFTKKHCQECWARYFCSGGCHANADLFNASIYEPYEMGCELAKIRTECAIAIAADALE